MCIVRAKIQLGLNPIIAGQEAFFSRLERVDSSITRHQLELIRDYSPDFAFALVSAQLGCLEVFAARP